MSLSAAVFTQKKAKPVSHRRCASSLSTKGTIAHMRMSFIGKVKGQPASRDDITHIMREVKDECMELNCLLAGGPHERFLSRFARGWAFRVFCIMMIAANTLYIGYEADWAIKDAFKTFEKHVHPESHGDDVAIMDMLFVLWFTLELLLRMGGQLGDFLWGPDKRWNTLDALLVLLSWFEVLVPGARSNFSFLRIFRVFRLVRVVRVVKSVPQLRSLRTMVFAVLNSFVCLLWAYAFMILMLYVFGVIFVKAVEGYLRSLPEDPTPDQTADVVEMKLYFGTMYETMVSLGASITGGNDWMQYAELLRKVNDNDMYFMIFQFYIFFIIVGLLNVVTGIFVDSAVCTRTEDEVVESFRINQSRTREEMRSIFERADTDGSGNVTFDELEFLLDDSSRVRAYFAGLDLDPSEARSMFVLMDLDKSGSVDIDEFVDGCLKIKGHAKSIDVLSIMYDNANQYEYFTRLLDKLSHDMEQLKGRSGVRHESLKSSGQLPERNEYQALSQKPAARMGEHNGLTSVVTTSVVAFATEASETPTRGGGQTKDDDSQSSLR